LNLNLLFFIIHPSYIIECRKVTECAQKLINDGIILVMKNVAHVFVD
jgi:hypothetical protein